MRKVISLAAVSTATSRAEVLTAQRIAVIFGVFYRVPLQITTLEDNQVISST